MTYRIIVADNSPSVQKIFELTFSAPEFELRCCRDTQELFTQLNETSPAGLILNLSLPGQDVYDLVAQLNSQSEFRSLPIILVQNAFESIEEKRLSSLVFTKLVTKPFDSEMVAEIIKESLRRTEEPQTLPEDVASDNPSGPAVEEPFPANPEDLAALARPIIREEIVLLERELEKRLRASLLAELKSWVEEKWRSRLKESGQNE